MKKELVNIKRKVVSVLKKHGVVRAGRLVKGLSPKEFGKTSRARNTLISDLLLRTKFVEKLGTGIKRIRDEAKKFGLLEPIFEFSKSFFVTFNGKIKVNEGLHKLYFSIKNNPGKRVPDFAKKLDVPAKTIERWILASYKRREKIIN
jgi:predicted HTH transcriptional regulator